MADVTEGIRGVIAWPLDLPNTRVVKVAGLERLVSSSLCRGLKEIMK